MIRIWTLKAGIFICTLSAQVQSGDPAPALLLARTD